MLGAKGPSKSVPIPAGFVKGRQECVAGAGEDDALILGIVMNIREGRDECAVQLEIPAACPSVAVHANLENPALPTEGEELLPFLGIVLEVGPIKLAARDRLGHVVISVRQAGKPF